MRILLSVFCLLVGVREISYGVVQFRSKQKKGALGTFLLLLITISVVIFTFYIGHS